jgi:hypothetical protein
LRVEKRKRVPNRGRERIRQSTELPRKGERESTTVQARRKGKVRGEDLDLLVSVVVTLGEVRSGSVAVDVDRKVGERQ